MPDGGTSVLKKPPYIGKRFLHLQEVVFWAIREKAYFTKLQWKLVRIWRSHPSVGTGPLEHDVTYSSQSGAGNSREVQLHHIIVNSDLSDPHLDLDILQLGANDIPKNVAHILHKSRMESWLLMRGEDSES